MVTLRAVDGSTFLNDLEPTLELRDPSSGGAAPILHVIPQTGPGEYTARLPAPRSSQIAAVAVGQRVIERFAVAGRYAPEFESIGNNRRTMEDLALRTGGAVILPTQTTPIVINWPGRAISIASPIALAGAVLIGLALILMRRAGTI